MELDILGPWLLMSIERSVTEEFLCTLQRLKHQRARLDYTLSLLFLIFSIHLHSSATMRQCVNKWR